ncbi:MAG TPA: hypothetical protein PKE30_09000 [Niabella sp.]|nr:hypothetical protein [Niabella sp.]
MDKEIGTLNEQEIRNAFVSYLSDKMAKADWEYDDLDDLKAWRRGSFDIEGIKAELTMLAKLDEGIAEAKRLWKQHAPKYSPHAPAFFISHEVLNNVFGGSLLRKDISETQEIFNRMQKNGDRFVVFEGDIKVIPRERFMGFPTATEAHSFAYEYVAAGRMFIVAAIADLQKELQCSSDPEIVKGQVLKEMAERLSNEDKSRERPGLSR